MEDRPAIPAARLQFKFERPLRVPQRQLDGIARHAQSPQPPQSQRSMTATAASSRPAPGVTLSSLFPLDIAVPASSLRIRRRFRLTKLELLIMLAGIMLALSIYLSATAWLINSRVQAQAVSGPVTTSAGSDPQVADSNHGIVETPVANLSAYKVQPTAPRFIFIDKLHIQARILKLGIGNDGALQTPRNSYDTGWYSESANPGDNGAMLIDGHALGPTKSGVFHDLKTLRAGDTIRVERGDGKTFTYVVNKVDILKAQDVPMDQLLVPVKPGTKGLNLISCTGVYNEKNETFNERAVVYATMQ